MKRSLNLVHSIQTFPLSKYLNNKNVVYNIIFVVESKIYFFIISDITWYDFIVTGSLETFPINMIFSSILKILT